MKLINRIKACYEVHTLKVSLVLAAVLALAVLFAWHGLYSPPVRSLPMLQPAKSPALPRLIATYRDVPPDMLTYSPGQHSGPLRYVIEEAGRRIGYAIDWRPMSISESIDAAVAGTIDIVPYVHFVSPDREEFMRFSVSLGKVAYEVNFIQPTDGEAQITSFDDLRGKTLGYRNGSYYYPGFKDATAFTKVGFPDDGQLVQAFADRRVEVLITNNQQAITRALSAEGVSPARYRLTDLREKFDTDLFLMYPKNSRNNETYTRFDEALSQMKMEGVIGDIYQSFDAVPPNNKQASRKE